MEKTCNECSSVYDDSTCPLKAVCFECGPMSLLISAMDKASISKSTSIPVFAGTKTTILSKKKNLSLSTSPCTSSNSSHILTKSTAVHADYEDGRNPITEPLSASTFSTNSDTDSGISLSANCSTHQKCHVVGRGFIYIVCDTPPGSHLQTKDVECHFKVGRCSNFDKRFTSMRTSNTRLTRIAVFSLPEHLTCEVSHNDVERKTRLGLLNNSNCRKDDSWEECEWLFVTGTTIEFVNLVDQMLKSVCGRNCERNVLDKT